MVLETLLLIFFFLVAVVALYTVIGSALLFLNDRLFSLREEFARLLDLTTPQIGEP